MRNEQRILRNTLVLAAGESLGQLANLAFVVAFARRYGAQVFGEYSFGMAVGAIAALAVSLGTHAFLLRELSRTPQAAARRIGLYSAPQALLVLLAWSGALAAAAAVMPLATGVLAIVIGYQLVHRAAALWYLPFRATERVVVPMAAELGHRLLVLAAGGAAMALDAAPSVTLAAMLAAVLLLAITGVLAHAVAFGVPTPRFAPRELGALLRGSQPFFGSALLATLYARSGPVLLGLVGTSVAVGAYAAADRIMVAALLVPTLLSGAALPAIVRVAAESPLQMQDMAQRLLRLVLLVTVPLAGLLCLFAAELVPLLLGREYVASTVALQLLALALPLQGTQQLLAAQLSALEMQHALVRIRLGALTLLLAAGPLAIHRLGFAGLALTMLACEALQLLASAWLLRRRGVRAARLAAVAAPLAAVAAAAAVTLWRAHDALAPRLLLFGATVALVSAMLGAVRPHEVRLVLALVFRRSPSVPRA